MIKPKDAQAEASFEVMSASTSDMTEVKLLATSRLVMELKSSRPASLAVAAQRSKSLKLPPV